MSAETVIELVGVAVGLVALVAIAHRGRGTTWPGSLIVLACLLVIQVVLHACDALEWWAFAALDPIGDTFRVLVPALWLVAIFTRNREQLTHQVETGARQLQLVLDSAPAAIAIFDHEGRYLNGSQAWCRRVGKSHAELGGQAFSDLDGAAVGFVRRLHARALASTEAVAEQDAVRLDWLGREEWVRGVASAWGSSTDEGAKRGVVMLVDFVTHEVREEARRRDEEQSIAHAQRIELVGTLAAGIAHDLNNFLMVIQGYAATAQVGRTAPSDALAAIVSASGSAAQLARSLAGLARVRGQARDVDLVQVVSSTMHLLSRMLPSGIDAKTDLPRGSMLVHVDPIDVQQMLVNLVLNARDAMPRGGVVQVSLSETGGVAKLAVKDNGEGIPAELQSKVLERFFTTKPAGSGTGLGLSLVTQLAERHGGTLTLSSAVGVGSVFTLSFPLLRTSPTPRVFDAN